MIFRYCIPTLWRKSLKMYPMYVRLVCPAQGQKDGYGRSDQGWTSKELMCSVATWAPQCRTAGPNTGLGNPTYLSGIRPDQTRQIPKVRGMISVEISPKVIFSVDSFLSLIKSIFGATSTSFVARPFFHREPARYAASLGWSKGLGHYQLMPCSIIYLKLSG